MKTAAPAAGPPARLTARELRRALGPGLVWAGAAIGVSHLVQSTRAGAEAGFALVGVILLALILKYPFFEYGPRYAAATGESLVEGYRRIGRWAVWLYFAITVATAFIVDAAIVLFTGFLLLSVLGVQASPAVAGGIVYLGCGLLLWVGRYRLLDRAMKVILLALAATTIVAAAVALPRVDIGTLALWPDVGTGGVVTFAFLLAVMGWMPSAIDVSVWSSLWTLAKDASEGGHTSVAAARADFLVGYLGTAVLAFAFVTLGAAVMHGSGVSFSPQGTAFSLELVDLYGATLGAWSRPLMLVAVLTTMLSTSLAVVDGFPRALARTGEVLLGHPAADAEVGETGRMYWGAMAGLGLLVVLLLAAFARSLTHMVDFATTVSFLTAPLLGYLNLRAVTGPDFPARHRPGPWLRALSWAGLVVLGGIGVLYGGWLLTR
ncbi:MAG TPA: divalent metal cation transporter [Longimicrobiales bacterium]|nr:divalent metal cation transporter [Longimicrobiales bacterium]